MNPSETLVIGRPAGRTLGYAWLVGSLDPPDKEDRVKVKFRMYPDDDGGRFAPTAFEDQIGKVIPVLADVGVSQATLIAATVAEDGTSAELTIDGDLRLPEEPISSYSIGFADDEP